MCDTAPFVNFQILFPVCVPYSSQYGLRGSEMSMADGVLDSGKASDLSVCSWPVEPIQWTPFPLLQQLALHRAPPVSVSQQYCYSEVLFRQLVLLYCEGGAVCSASSYNHCLIICCSLSNQARVSRPRSYCEGMELVDMGKSWTA